MPFIGLQPIIDKIPLPQKLRSSLSLQESGGDVPIPCYIVSSSITREYTIPQEPVDSNQYVSDTIINQPVTISLVLFVYEQYAKEFFEIIHRIQKGNKGFVFVDRKEMRYPDLYMTSYSYTESGDQVGAFDVSLELQQVVRVAAVASTVTKIGIGDVKSKGTATAQLVEKAPAQAKSGDSTLFKWGQSAKGMLGNLTDKLSGMLP